MYREQILHLWLIITLTGKTTTSSFLFLFYFHVSKIFLNLTCCWDLTRHFMKLKNYTKLFGCKLEGMLSGWVVWYSVVENITLFDIYPCHGKYALVNVSHVLFNRVHSSFWSLGKEITTKEANCLRKNSETFGILEIAFFNKISLSWQDKRVNVLLNSEFVFSRRQWNLPEV